MTFNQKIQQMFEACKSQNITAREFSRKLLQNSPRRQSALKNYLISRGKTAPVGIIAQAEAAGYEILQEFSERGENPQEFFAYDINQVPGRFRFFNFYGLATEYPAAFLACLVLSVDSPVSNFSLQDIGDAAKNAYKSVKQTFEKVADGVKDVAGNIADAGKKYVGAAPRTAFLGLVELNVRNFARRLDLAITNDRQKVKNFWENVIGGDFAKLVSSVNRGKKKNPILPGNNFDPTTITAAILAATPIIVAANDLLQKINGAKDKQLETQSQPDTKNTKFEFPEIGNIETPFGNIKWGLTNNKAVLTGLALAAVALVAVFYFTRKGGK
jgi:hypothetical protein